MATRPGSRDPLSPARSPPCALEALRVLNCVAADDFSSDKCLVPLIDLRKCIESQRVTRFSIVGEKDSVLKMVDETGKPIETKKNSSNDD